jgi:hypothetical protein
MPSSFLGERANGRGNALGAIAAGLGLLLASVGVSCAPPSEARRPAMDAATWQSLRAALDAERARGPRMPWAAGLRMTMQEPRSGRTIDGRGALAVAPGRALRMILVGPAGATMLDAWVTAARWRIAVPPADVLRRGGADDPEELPVGFLRWLFFRPLEGALFGGSRGVDGTVFLLRDGEAVVEVRLGRCERGELETTTRRIGGRAEKLEVCRRASATPGAGDWVRYENEATRLHIDLTLETVGATPPQEEAFVDPDRAAEAPR